MIEDFFLETNGVYTIKGFFFRDKHKQSTPHIIKEMDVEELKAYQVKSESTPMNRFFRDLRKGLNICRLSTNKLLFTTFLDEQYRIKPVQKQKLIPLESKMVFGENLLQVDVNDRCLNPTLNEIPRTDASLFLDTEFNLKYMKFYPEAYYTSDIGYHSVDDMDKLHNERKHYREFLKENFKSEGFEKLSDFERDGYLIFDGYLKPQKENVIQFSPDYIMAFHTFNKIGTDLFVPTELKYEKAFTIKSVKEDKFSYLDKYDVVRSNSEIKEMMKEVGEKDLYNLRQRCEGRIIIDDSNQKNVKMNVKSVLIELLRHKGKRQFYEDYYNNIIANFS